MGSVAETTRASLAAEFAKIERLDDRFLLASEPRDQRARPNKRQSVLVATSLGEEGLGPGEAERLAVAFERHQADCEPHYSYLVLASGKGVPTHVARRLAEAGVTRHGLIEFLDRYSASSSAGHSGRIVRSFARLHKHLVTDRVPHRYQRIGIDGLPLGEVTTGDLLADLLATLSAVPTQPRLTLITGQAGGGKTVLFKALFAALYDRFNDIKSKKFSGLHPRPIFFVPDYLKQAASYSFDSLVDAMFETDSAEPVPPEYLAWLHATGNVILMFDGMDEVLARQSDLFDRLAHTMTRPGSSAQVVMCVRDSLLATNDRLINFLRSLGDATGPQAVDLVRLLRWGEAERRALATLRLGGNQAEGSALSGAAARFEAMVAASPTLAELCQTAFFCDLLIELHKAGGGALPADMLDILDLALDRFLDREVTKLRHHELTEDVRAAYLLGEVEEPIGADPMTVLLSAADREALASLSAELGAGLVDRPEFIPALIQAQANLSRHGVLDLLAAAAHRYRRSAAGSGLGEDQLAALLEGEGRANGASDGERRFRAMLMFKQIALFSQRPGTRAVDFTHEFLADHLAARHALNLLHDDAGRLDEAIGDLSAERTEVFDRALARGLADDPDLARRVASAVADGRGQPIVRSYLQERLASLDAGTSNAA